MSAREMLMRNWLEQDQGYSDYTLTIASADASFRRYYRLHADGRSYIVMDAPPELEDCRPYINVSSRLLNAGLNAPEVLAGDPEKGFLLLTDLGQSLYLDSLSESNADRLYTDALRSLMIMQRDVSPSGLPDYDEMLLQNEMDLFRDWLLEKHLGIVLTGREYSEFDTICHWLIDNALEQPSTFVHRDYHSRNLIYCEVDNPGILDFQDAVRGPLSYDLVSLLKDCYIKWPAPKIHARARNFYESLENKAFSMEEFIIWFDLMGVQRHLKASGIFARLWHRDGKPAYLKDIPRTLSYITDLGDGYAGLKPLIGLINERVLPALEKEEKACGP